MRLHGVLGALGVVALGCAAPSGLKEKIDGLLGKEPAPPVEAPATAPVPVAQEEIVVGVPKGSESQPVPDGVFYRYTNQTIDVQRARQFHDSWFRRKGWQPQIDQATATGWTMEAVKGETRMIVDIQPLGAEGVNVIFKIL